MARASCVYVVFGVNANPEFPTGFSNTVAGFTVKHELVTFLNSKLAPKVFRVIRLKDGVYYSSSGGVDITDEIVEIMKKVTT